MNITITTTSELKNIDPSVVYSIEINDEALLGENVILTYRPDPLKPDSINCATIAIEDFNILLPQVSKATLISYYSKAIYKKFPALIECDSIIHDITLASYVNNGSAKHNLDAIAQLLGLDTALPATVKTLLIHDSWKQILNPAAQELWHVENNVARILAGMELRGIKIDKSKLLELKDSYKEEADRLSSQIKEGLSAPDVNINSNKQLGDALTKAGFKLGRPGKSGSPSVKEEVLEKLVVTDELGVIQKILDYRTVQKMYSTYTDSFLSRLDSDDRLHGEYNQTVAATGRLSSANPNLQNIPIRHPKYGSDLRSVFIAQDGYTLISADYSQIELRVLAHLCQDPRLLEAFRNDEDIHSVTASEIFGVPLDQVTKKQRGVGKTLNFALMYQQGHTSTAKQMGVSNAEAKVYHEKYFEKFANVKPFIDTVLKDATINGYAETLYGRRAYYPDLQSDQGFIKAYAQRAAFNMPIQGGEADIVKMAMIELDSQIKKSTLDCTLLLQIHDEIVFEVKDSEVEKAKQLIKQAMELGQPLTCPLKVEIHSGKNWNEAK